MLDASGAMAVLFSDVEVHDLIAVFVRSEPENIVKAGRDVL
jgi:hypothetical protein